MIAALRGGIITTGRSGISTDNWLKHVEREKVLVSESAAKVEDDNVSYFRILLKFLLIHLFYTPEDCSPYLKNCCTTGRSRLLSCKAMIACLQMKYVSKYLQQDRNIKRSLHA